MSPQQPLRETRHNPDSPNDADRISDICASLSPTTDEAHIPEALDEEETNAYDVLETCALRLLYHVLLVGGVCLPDAALRVRAVLSTDAGSKGDAGESCATSGQALG